MKIKSLVVSLYDPPKIAFSEKRLGSENLVLDGKMLSPPYFPLWATSADILVNSKRSEFVGLTYQVNDGKEIVETLVKELSPRVVQYINSGSDKNADLYLKYNISPDHFEIRWSDATADCVESAQLGSDFWYYEERSNQNYKFKALGLNDIDEILQDYKLKFPTDITLKSFKPIFAGIH